jgi:hypothetical protein
MDTRRVGSWRAVALSLIAASPASAAVSKAGEGAGMWLVLFLGLGAFVILLQAIPALVMLGSMLKALFAPAANSRRAGSEARSSNET